MFKHNFSQKPGKTRLCLFSLFIVHSAFLQAFLKNAFCIILVLVPRCQSFNQIDWQKKCLLNLTSVSGAVLKGTNAEVSWDPEMNDKEEFPRANKLIVKQLLLGVDADKDEYNVVEVSDRSCWMLLS